jgi:uncharacterized protein YndB with AHSA1/START domain
LNLPVLVLPSSLTTNRSAICNLHSAIGGSLFKVIIAIVASIIVMIGVVWVVGSRLPVGHVATRTVVIDAPIDSVFNTMTDFASVKSWRPGVKSMTVSTDSAGRQLIVEESSQGKMPMVIEEHVPPTRFVTRITDKSLPYGGAWAHALEAQGNTTRVTITEHGEVYDPIFRFISRYFMGHTGTMDAYLTDLGKKFGTEVILIDAAPVPIK